MNDTKMKFNDKKFIAQKIKQARIRANLTQSELAEKVNLSTQHISRIESGCYIQSLSSFFNIISILNIDLYEFGYNVNNADSNKKNALIEIICNSSGNELKLYDSVVNGLNIGLLEIKNKLFL